MPLRRCAVLLFALGGAIALVTMHGATAHGLELPHSHSSESESASPASGAHADSHDHGADDHDDGAPCPSCGHDAAALCALIVLGVAIVPRRATAALGYLGAVCPRPPLRSWSPDPPVPKAGLVLPAL